MKEVEDVPEGPSVSSEVSDEDACQGNAVFEFWPDSSVKVLVSSSMLSAFGGVVAPFTGWPQPNVGLMISSKRLVSGSTNNSFSHHFLPFTF